ncbi:serine/threonine protein phosphatase [Comamonas serinivorans]|uniref:Serine/threonine protein phosphatase n=1 Tax=Comamonas serinivorans TaxID=1082851 RepID=A0A1Y0ENW6_9BURK|nr:PP2C family serine/threonine-protein phosphatase [Comamonas serinivorans]ARU05101.1 serine/threonine protein phosphatase [Comamonas serinivorans]
MKFSVFQLTRRGGRDKNEDRMGYCYTREAALFVLADGMGGHPEGEVAAQLALQAMSAMFQRDAKPTVANPEEFLGAALLAAHHQIIRYAAERGFLDSPRTTLVACLLQDNQVTWVHCGDSRLYVVRDGSLLTRTRDHSYAEQQASGVFKLGNVNRNVLFTCLGSPSRPVFDVGGPIKLQQGDRFLLCSDGLWGTVEDDEIAGQLASKPVSEAVPDLVELALVRGGSTGDNVTVISAEWQMPTVVDSHLDSITTDLISEDVFASTIQASLVDSSYDDLDDDAIERSIAEINAAIARSSARRQT